MKIKYFAVSGNGLYLCLDSMSHIWYLSCNPVEAFLFSSKKNAELTVDENGLTGMIVQEYRG